MVAEARFESPDLRCWTGRGVRILVVDSGAVDHPVFAGQPPVTFGLEATADGPWSIAPEAAKDMYGHGTAVCGLLHTHAPNAELTSLRVLGTDLRAHSARVIHAIGWGIDQGFDLINCSFGSSALQHLPDYKRVVDRAFIANVWMVAAVNAVGAMQEYPGCFTSVFGTRAGDLADPLSLRRIPGDIVEFEAAGLGLAVAWKDGGTRIVSGSSLAAPHLCAQLARLREVCPQLNACEARTLMYQWARGT